MTSAGPQRSSASFRDPSGFVFEREGVLFRQVNASYSRHWSLLNQSGLLKELIDEGLLVGHEQAPLDHAFDSQAIAVLRPRRVPFVTYPYEWSFGQLKEAALLTLEIQRRAIGRGMTLKDATAYNVLFEGGRPVFIDTLSFEALDEGKPWIAYGQFCRHFLAPLALIATVDHRCGELLRTNLDGIPLDLAARLLPMRSRLSSGLAMHLHMHARSDKASASESSSLKVAPVSRTGLLSLVASLRRTIEGLNWSPKGTEWGDYYANTNYSEGAMEAKRRLVGEFLAEIEPGPKVVWDLGANTGAFSRLAADLGASVVAIDVDPAAVEGNYLALKAEGVAGVLPMVANLANPSPGIGWANRERDSLLDRANADAVMALALIHHLAIGNNVPLGSIAELFARLGRWAIVEFVPKEDGQVQRLLRAREDVFAEYSIEGCRRAFELQFEVVRQAEIAGTVRTLFLLRRLS